MKQKKLLTIILTLIIMNLYHCKDTGLSPGEFIDPTPVENLPIDGEPYQSYFSGESRRGSMELRLNTKLKAGMSFNNIVLDVTKVQARKKMEDDDSSENDHESSGDYFADGNVFKVIESAGNDDAEHDDNWLDLAVPPVKLDIIRFSRHQLVLAAGIYNLVPGIYDRVRVTLGRNSYVNVNGVNFPLYVSGDEGYGSEQSSHAENDKIIIEGDVNVIKNKLTGVVLNFDPSKDIHSINHDSGHDGKGHGNTIVAYKMKKHFEAQQISVLGTNFPVSPPEYNMLTNVTLDKTEVCKDEEIKVYTSFVKPNGNTGGITVSVSGSTGGETAIVSFPTEGLKMITIGVSDVKRNIESLSIPVLVRGDCINTKIVNIREVENSGYRGKTFLAETPGMTGNISYQWDFGDGSRLTTNDPVGTHNYDNRVQNSKVENYIVTVTAVNSSESRTGRKSITMLNPHYVAAFYKAQYYIEGNGDSVLKKNGSGYRANFSLNNPGNFSVSFYQVEERLQYCNRAIADTVTLKGAQSIIGITGLANFASHAGTIALSTLPDGVCSVAYSILGNTSPGGVPALANLYFTAETAGLFTSAKPVSPEKSAKIEKAMKALGYPASITEEDILRLELQKKI